MYDRARIHRCLSEHHGDTAICIPTSPSVGQVSVQHVLSMVNWLYGTFALLALIGRGPLIVFIGSQDPVTFNALRTSSPGVLRYMCAHMLAIAKDWLRFARPWFPTITEFVMGWDRPKGRLFRMAFTRECSGRIKAMLIFRRDIAYTFDHVW